MAKDSLYPPAQDGWGVFSGSSALLAHAALIAALTWGISWQREHTPVVVAAELWSETPQQAAPLAAPEPPPVAKPEPEPGSKAPDITTDKTKIKPEPQPKPEPKLSKKELEAERQRELARQEQLMRMTGLAGTSKTTGSAAQNSAPSASYEAKVQAAVRPNIVFAGADALNGNPAAEFEVRLGFDGTITRVTLLKSSGVADWDKAAERGIERTQQLPRDADGRFPSPLVLVLRPKR